MSVDTYDLLDDLNPSEDTLDYDDFSCSKSMKDVDLLPGTDILFGNGL